MRTAMPSRYLMCSSCALLPFLHCESFCLPLFSSLFKSGAFQRESNQVLVVYYYYTVPFIHFSISHIINTCTKESY